MTAPFWFQPLHAKTSRSLGETVDQEKYIAQLAHELVSSFPSSSIESLAEAIGSTPEPLLSLEISRRVAHFENRDKALAFVRSWKTHAPEVSAKTASVAILAAALTEKHHRDYQSVELVWTGPEVDGEPFRRTEQAILQLLDAAKERITLVSFAVYSIPNVAKSLVKAASRGVQLTVIIETPDKLGGLNDYSTLQALGPDVASCSKLYYWPKENRPLSETSKPGLLHIKCAVADAHWMFLSSANLTQQAFTINMELGILVRGGSMPRSVQEQFELLIKTGQLQEL